jgi:hypothetical protein
LSRKRQDENIRQNEARQSFLLESRRLEAELSQRFDLTSASNFRLHPWCSPRWEHHERSYRLRPSLKRGTSRVASASKCSG